ncbi:hypothetical protein DH2020_028073 [Rehmannia glutinosa]|uniref:FAF domain-containing protein n=1 Tax=Rehmannia glutinosa TaxID=99300 RepID=A0ABR0VTE7_REHGL
MAACGGLEHIIEKPLPENPTLLESLSPWKQIKSMKTIDHHHQSSFTEIFGELHFKENDHVQESTSSSPSSSLSSNSMFSADIIPNRDENGISSIHQEKIGNPTSSYCPYGQKKQYTHSDSFSSMNSESLSVCTEGLGFESFGDAEDLVRNEICNNNNNDCQFQEEKKTSFTRNRPAENENHWGESKRSRTSIGEFPPPVSCIGRSGKPFVSFKSFRQDGRIIIKEIRIPTQELLHACRENGRLKLQLIQPDDDDILEEDENKENIQ